MENNLGENIFFFFNSSQSQSFQSFDSAENILSYHEFNKKNFSVWQKMCHSAPAQITEVALRSSTKLFPWK